MGSLDGRVAIVTGAGRGLGREHALLLAREGASVVVNDVGNDPGGNGFDPGPARRTADEIEAFGGNAVANYDDVSDWHGAQRLVAQAIDTFAKLDVLVNNAGILRDRVIVNVTETDWDDVVRVHLRGHFAPVHHAAGYWRDQAKAGIAVNASIVHTTSVSGLFANPGQAGYGAAKSAIATVSQICAKELRRYGVRSNAVSPTARTRMTESVPGYGDIIAAPREGFDAYHPGNVSPLVAYLATADCPFTGETFHVHGGLVQRVQSWSLAESIESPERWTVEGLAAAAHQLHATVAVAEPTG